MIRRALPWLQLAFVVIAIVFIILFLRSNWQELRSYPWQILPGWFAVAISLLIATWLVEVEIWRRILGQMGGHLPLTAALRMWFLSAIVRYIPGNIWQTISLAIYCRRWNIRTETTIASLVVYQVVIIIAVVPVAVSYVLFGRYQLVESTVGVTLSLPAKFIMVAVSVLIVLLLISYGQMLFTLADWILTRMQRQPLALDMNVRFLAAILLLALFDWLLWGSTFAAFSYSLGIIELSHRLELLPDLVTSYPLAYIIGLLSFFTPSGLGVREGAFLFLLTPQLDVAVVAVIAIAMRVWTTAGELLAAGIAAIFGPIAKPLAQSSDAAAAHVSTLERSLESHTPRRPK